jgi:hypothetical protein
MTTKKSCNSFAKGGKVGRVKPTIAKAGVTKNRSRRYGCGGKLKTK